MSFDTTSILIGFIVGCLIGFFTGKVLQIGLFIAAVGIFGFLMYLKFWS